MPSNGLMSTLNPSHPQFAGVDMMYPHGYFETRAVSVGGRSKKQLLAQLAEAGVELNEAAVTLFAGNEFTTQASVQSLITVELMVRQLGFVRGATTLELFDRAVELGLRLAPLELGEMTANNQGDRTAVPLSNFDACRQNSNHCDCIVTGLPAAVDHSNREAASPTLKAPINPFL